MIGSEVVVRVVLLLLLAGCGSSPPKRPPLPEGRGLYTVRFNPPPCLVARPELQVEVQTPQGWERVALDLPDEGEDDLVAGLLERFAGLPEAELAVEARLTNEVVAWSGRHQSRVLRLIALDPEAPDER